MKQMQFVSLCMLVSTILTSCAKVSPTPPPLTDSTVNQVRADFVGQDPLGIQHPKFPLQAFVKFLPVHSTSGNLHWSFGTSLENVEAVLRSGKVNAWRVHFYNGPGLRNRQLGSYEPHYGMTVGSFNAAWEKSNPKQVAWLSREVGRYCTLFTKYPNVVLEMSPTLEHDLSKAAWMNQAKVVSTRCPAARLVNSPDGGVRIGVAYKYEGHGSKWSPNAPCNQSYDGQNANDADVARHKTRFAACDYMRIWTGCYNGLCKGAWVLPRKRTAWPNADQLQDLFSYEKVLPPTPPAPESCRVTTKVAPPYIWKPWAEDTGDPRSNKPVYISNFKDPSGIKVIGMKGSLIARLPLYGNFGNTQWRYYSGGLGGPQFAAHTFSERAQSLDGSPYIYLVEGKDCEGPFISTYRQGVMR